MLSGVIGSEPTGERAFAIRDGKLGFVVEDRPVKRPQDPLARRDRDEFRPIPVRTNQVYLQIR